MAELFLYPSRVRKRLAQHLYSRDIPNNPIGSIDAVLKKVIAVEPLEKKLNQAVREKQIKSKTYLEKIEISEMMKLITTDEANQLRETFDASMQIINVDDFSPEVLLSPSVKRKEG